MDAADADALEASALTRAPERAGSLVGRGPTKPADVRPTSLAAF
jgi:hypothetical protein